MPKRRANPVAHSPLLRKGGVHQQARSGQRFKAKQTLKRQLAELKGDNNGGRGPRFFWLPPTMKVLQHAEDAEASPQATGAHSVVVGWHRIVQGLRVHLR